MPKIVSHIVPVISSLKENKISTMKTCFVLVFVSLVACVIAEPCRDTRDCRDRDSVTTCSSGYEVFCNREHQCECLTSSSSGACTMQSDCHMRCDGGRDAHCIDGHCRCQRN